MAEKSKRGKRSARATKARSTKARPTKARPTKARVVQARIPEQLDDELRDRADQLGLSVSTIVRNVLFHTFDLVEGVVTDSAQVARVIQGRKTPAATASEPSPAPPEAEVEVVGWQEAILNRNGVCESCNAILALGERAAIGVPTAPRPVLMCLDCLADLSAPADPQAPATELPVEVKSSPGKRRRKP